MADTILVVEDQDDLRLLIRLSLKNLGRVLQASNAEQAYAVVAAERPSLVVLDVWLGPGPSGLEVCRAIKADPANPALCVILLSACGQQSDIAAGYAAGADHYIVKPFSPEHLILTAAELLQR